MIHSIYLNKAENLAIELLAQGKRMREVREKCGFSSTSFHFYAFLNDLRRKTGIADIQDIEACQAYQKAIADIEQSFADTKNPREISETHTRILEWALDQKPLAWQSRQLEIPEADIPALQKAAFQACGIFAKDPRAIRMQIRMHFAVRGNFFTQRAELAIPHWKALRAIADGMDVPSALDMKPGNALNIAREACARAWITCPGKGSQQKLAKLFLDSRAAKVASDDPAF